MKKSILSLTLLSAIFLLPSVTQAEGLSNPITELPSGVVVKHTGDGVESAPKPTDTIEVHYRGYLENGDTFDSSYARGEPATFGLNQVVSCWTQAFQVIRVGGKATITCPSHTAYGPNGIPGVIPGDATLFFDVELLGIK